MTANGSARALSWAAEALSGGAQIAVTLVGAPLLRRSYNHWGATPEEVAASLPGDELVAQPKLASTRAITIDAPPDEVWPWLVQIGQGRGGLYSFDALENLVGCDLHSAERVLPEYQRLDPGDQVALGPEGYPSFQVVAAEPPGLLVLESVDLGSRRDGFGTKQEPIVSTWQWRLKTMPGGRTRLISRQLCTYPSRQSPLWHILEPIDFVMERRMLRGLKERAERRAGPLATVPQPTFSEAEIEGLPEPVQRYFRAAIQPGTPLATSAALDMRGSIKLGGRWLPLRAPEELAPHRGFVWRARVALVISGSDRYEAGSATIHWRLLGVVPLVLAGGPDVSASAAARGMAEAVWLPTSLLPRFGVSWSAPSPDGIVARFRLDRVDVELHIRIDGDGKVLSATFDRWGDLDNTGEWGLHPAGMEVRATSTFDGLTVPAGGRFGWFTGTPRWSEGEFFRFHITGLRAVS